MSGYPIYRTQAEPRLSNVVAWEHEYEISRERVTILGGVGGERRLKMGQVLGQVAVGDPVITPQPGNTGNGIVFNLSYGPAAMAGQYRLTCIDAVVGGGLFEVIDPTGRAISHARVGFVYSAPAMSFELTSGTVDWAFSDQIVITVPPGSGFVREIAFDLRDGTQNAYGILAADATAPEGEPVPGLAIVRKAVILPDRLIWPGGASPLQIDSALEQLKQADIYTRQEG